MINQELRNKFCKGCENDYTCYRNNTRCTPFNRELRRLMNQKNTQAEETEIIDKLSDLILKNESIDSIIELTVALRKLRHPDE